MEPISTAPTSPCCSLAEGHSQDVKDVFRKAPLSYTTAAALVLCKTMAVVLAEIEALYHDLRTAPKVTEAKRCRADQPGMKSNEHC